jgi:hypothetical protein
MAEIGIGECELFSGHIEPRPQMARQGPNGRPTPNPGYRDEIRKWRLTTPLDTFTAVKKKFDAAGVKLQAYNYSFNDSFTDEEIERGFEMAKALGVKVITASATVSVAKRVARLCRQAQDHGRHAQSRQPDRSEPVCQAGELAAAMAHSKYIGINLDIGHFTAANYDPIAYINEASRPDHQSATSRIGRRITGPTWSGERATRRSSRFCSF